MTVTNSILASRVYSIACVAALIVLLGAVSFAGQPSGNLSARDAVELVRRAVTNEIKAADDDGVHFMFQGIKTTPKECTTRLYIETREATAGLAIAYGGNPLTAEQRRSEEARVERFVDNPEELKRKHEQERENAERTLRIVRAMPDAFDFEYAGEERGSPGIGLAGAPLVKLKFAPRPGYEPPSRVEEVLLGMKGYVLVDAVHFRIATIDGTLFREVGFGWGILGHLDRGGRFVVHQQEVQGDHWEVSSMSLSFTGKILVFKNLSINSTEVFSGFKPVPTDLTFAQGVALLKKSAGSIGNDSPTSDSTSK
jgi:hypothetical protein